jgi:hypothetical protein
VLNLLNGVECVESRFAPLSRFSRVTT